MEAAQNLVVLKTIEGMAQGAAFTLDNMGDTDIVGTLAGDDTHPAGVPRQRACAGFLRTGQADAAVSGRGG